MGASLQIAKILQLLGVQPLDPPCWQNWRLHRTSSRRSCAFYRDTISSHHRIMTKNYVMIRYKMAITQHYNYTVA